MQSEGFGPEQILEHAIKAEKIAEDFYSKAAIAASEPVYRSMLLGLSSMELEHSSALKAIRDRIASKPNENPVRSTDAVVAGFLSSWLGAEIAQISGQELRKIAESGDLPSILKKGVEIEKDIISFYAGLERYLTDVESVEALEKILHEELRHYADLGEALRTLRKTGTGSDSPNPAGADGV